VLTVACGYCGANVEAAKAESVKVAEAANSAELEDREGLPTVEASINYGSMKIERGQVENRDSVFGWELELEWFGVFGGVESCYDMTGINNRRGRYNEVESFLGYRRSFGDFTASAAYVYKRCLLEEPDTQEVELEFEYETKWVTPFLEWEIDTKQKPGAMYGELGVKREWELHDRVTAIALAGVGAGNASRNRMDFDADRCAFRDLHLGLGLEIELCPHAKLVPAVDLYDYFTSAQRHVYDRVHGFAAVGSCSLVVEF